MSKEVDKATVFRTTQVRTKLKGDNSWLLRRNEPEAETKEEKPWLAEVRAGRLNEDPIETSPVSSPTKPSPPPTKSDSERAPTPGYLIRGVWTKLDKPASSSTPNGYSGTTQFAKKPSESYKKIAPHTVKSTSENQEGLLSKEEQEKRTEAASGVLRKTAARQRSYVLSAAKKFESQEPQDPSLDNTSVSFVAKRVEITDDDESASTPAPASSPPLSPIAPVTSVASVPQPKPRKIADSSVKTPADVPVNEPVAPKVVEKEKPAPEPVKEDPPPVSVIEKDPFDQMTPGCTKVDTPLPVLLPEFVQAVCTKPEAKDSDISAQDDKPLVELAPAIPTPASPAPASTVPESPLPVPLTPQSPAPVSPVPVSLTPQSPAPVSPVPVSLTPLSPAPVSPVPVSAVTEITVKTEPEPELEQEPEPSPKPSSSVDTLTALSDTLISFGTSSTSFKDDEPVLAEEEGGSADSRTTENGAEQEPAPELSNCVPMTDDLLALSDGPEASAAEPVPPSPGRWSQDLLSGLDSESSPAKTSGTLDLLANDDIVITTEARSLSMQREEEKQTDETAKETQSPTETVTITTKTVIITDKSEESNADPWSSHVTTTVTESSSADPFDPYPIGTTSPNSSSDLLQPLSDISINRVSTTSTENKDPSPETNMSSNALESLADDIIPINTDTTRLSTRRSWTRSWEPSTPQQTNTEESQDAEPEGQAADQETLIMFERKSKENDSPWDRWTSPTVYTITTTTGEEEEEEEEEGEEEEESPKDAQTVTTITTIRETRSELEPAMDRGSDYSTSSTTRYSYSSPSTRSSYETYSRTVTEEDQRVQTPEPEAKKGFVFVKEYVDTTQLSLHNAKDTIDGGSDYLTSSSNRYLYSSPSTRSSGSLSSTCTYCGELVGNDAKISIEHLNINCHPACFKCAVCSKPMGDLLDSMFLHGGKVNCESCYSKAFE